MGERLDEVYRDRWLVVVDKPAGLPTQRTRADERGVYEILADRERYVGLHHRLDRSASGLVLLTRDRTVNRAISEDLRAHRIERRYLAVLDGDAVEGTWAQPVEGQLAETTCVVLGRGRGTSAVELTLATGRKHQIRVHAALAGTPVLGDRRYGGAAARAWPRLALHAWRLGLRHPVSGERLTLTSTLPADLVEAWRAAGGPNVWEEPRHPEG